MSRMTRFWILAFAALPLTATSFAMEPNTYRPGQPYHAYATSNESECASTCQADNVCRSWNFIYPAAQSQRGICELNSLDVEAVSSAASVSGSRPSVQRSAEIIAAGTRTVRVGQPSPPMSRSQPRTYAPQQSLAPQPRRNISPPTETFISPVLVQRVKAMTQHQQDLKNNLRRAYVLDTQVAPRPTQSLAAAQAPRAPQPQTSTGVSTPRPSAPQRSLSPAPINRSNVGTATQTQDSLFGSLYDDVIAPKSLTASDIPSDPNAPIPTVRSVTTQPVSAESLE